jgi:hypothetical protein
MAIGTIQKTIMIEEKKEEAKQDDTAEQPADQTAPADETKDSQDQSVQTGDGEETVTLSKKELETLKKKAEDFEKSIELKRLAKLANKGAETDPTDGADVADKIAKLEEELSAFKAQSYNSSLTEAYRSFVADNPWANDDAKFDKIKENFSPAGTETKEELLAKMKLAAQTAFPTEYEKHLEDKIKAKVLSQKPDIQGNGSAGPANTIHQDTNQKTKEDLHKERLASLLDKHTAPWLKK